MSRLAVAGTLLSLAYLWESSPPHLGGEGDEGRDRVLNNGHTFLFVVAALRSRSRVMVWSPSISATVGGSTAHGLDSARGATASPASPRPCPAPRAAVMPPSRPRVCTSYDPSAIFIRRRSTRNSRSRRPTHATQPGTGHLYTAVCVKAHRHDTVECCALLSVDRTVRS